MAKKPKNEEVVVEGAQEEEEQQEFRDFDFPDDVRKPLLRAARLYGRFKRARVEAGGRELDAREKLSPLVKDAIHKFKVPADKDGVYKFSTQGVVFTLTPREELIKAKFPDENGDDE